MESEFKSSEFPAQLPLIFENLVEATPFNREKCQDFFRFGSRIIFEKPSDMIFEGDNDHSVTDIIIEEDEDLKPKQKGILKTPSRDWSRKSSNNSPRSSSYRVTFTQSKLHPSRIYKN